MKKVILLGLIFMFVLSCNKKDKTYYQDGSLKTIVGISNSRFHGPFKAFYENGDIEIEGLYEYGAMQGIFTYYRRLEHQFSKSEMLFKNDTVYYWWNYNKSGKLVEEGSVKEDSKVGKWTYYDIEDGYTKKVREVFYINEKSHLNQEWELNRKGDTVGGNFLLIMTNYPMELNHQLLSFDINQLPYFEESTFFIFIPNQGNKQFTQHFLNEKEIFQDTLAGFVKSDNGFKYQNGKENVIDVFLDYDSPGEKTVRGIIVEKKTIESQDSLDFNNITRKIYFEKEIYIRD